MFDGILLRNLKDTSIFIPTLMGFWLSLDQAFETEKIPPSLQQL